MIQRSGDRVADELTALAARGASGTLEISGDPGGIIYLSDGYPAFAETATAPNLGSRLVNSRRMLVDQWSRARQDSQPDVYAGDLLLHQRLIDPPEWQILVRSATLDALVTLGIGLAGDPPGSDTSFTTQPVRFTGSVQCMDTGSAWAYAVQEAERLTGHDVGPAARPQLRQPSPAWPAFGRDARTVLGQINGRATLRDLAWRNGLALYGVMDWLVRLIGDGVCTVPGRAAGGAPRSADGAGIPRRADGADMRWTFPEPHVLRQVLTALKRLD